MTSVVALVRTRPETIGEDYLRVLNLAGMGSVVGEGSPRLVAMGKTGEPGFSTPPWQVDYVLKALGLTPDPDQVLAWQALRASGDVFPLPGGTDGPLVLLTVPILEKGWGVRNAVAGLADLSVGSVTDPLKGVESLARAWSSGVGRSVGFVCDGALWGVGGGTLGQTFLQRNVLLASTDPVALDSVCLQLAGFNPRDFPWLQILENHGLGLAAPENLKLRGEAELITDPFAGGPLVGRSGSDKGISHKLSRGLWNVLRRRRVRQGYRGSAWGQLATALEKH